MRDSGVLTLNPLQQLKREKNEKVPVYKRDGVEGGEENKSLKEAPLRVPQPRLSLLLLIDRQTGYQQQEWNLLSLQFFLPQFHYLFQCLLRFPLK